MTKISTRAQLLATAPRAVKMAPRADATDVKALIGQINGAFEEFKKTTDAKVNDADVLVQTKLEAINADLTRLSSEFEAQAKALAAARLGGGSQGTETPEAAEHRKAFNQWFRRGIEPANMRDLEVKAALTTQSDPDGGYIVPEQMDAAIDRVTMTMSSMRAISNVVSVGTATYKKLVNLGGTGSGWVGEEQSRPETTTPRLSEIAIPTMELYANPAATQTMLDDGMFDVESWLANEIAVEFAEEEGAAFVAGNGVNRPFGFTSYPKVANGSYAWGKLGYVFTGQSGAFASTAPADKLIELYYALRPGYRNNAVWIMSDAIMLAVRQMKDLQGSYLWAAPTQAGEVPTVLGKNVYADENMQGLVANGFPIAFGDFRRGYTITDRAGARLLRDPYTAKPNVFFYTTKRVGGAVTNFEAIKLLKLGTS